MLSTIRKLVLGIIIGCVVTMLLTSEADLSVGMQFQTSLFIISWMIGLVYSARNYLGKLNKLLNPSLKLSVISFLSFGSGFWGAMLLIGYVLYIITFGWLYGWYMLIVDVASFLHH